jgi:hypothetical protein
MAIVGGLDIHRRQITYDWIDTAAYAVGSPLRRDTSG